MNKSKRLNPRMNDLTEALILTFFTLLASLVALTASTYLCRRLCLSVSPLVNSSVTITTRAGRQVKHKKVTLANFYNPISIVWKSLIHLKCTYGVAGPCLAHPNPPNHPKKPPKWQNLAIMAPFGWNLVIEYMVGLGLHFAHSDNSPRPPRFGPPEPKQTSRSTIPLVN